MSKIKRYAGWPLPPDYYIEEVKTYWTKSQPETAYIAYWKQKDEEDWQLGTFHHFWFAAFKIWQSHRLQKQIKRFLKELQEPHKPISFPI